MYKPLCSYDFLYNRSFFLLPTMNEKLINYVYDDHENEFDETVNSYDLEFINDNNAETENDLIDNNNEETEDKLLELFNKAIIISFKTNLIL